MNVPVLPDEKLFVVHYWPQNDLKHYNNTKFGDCIDMIV